MAKAMLTSSTSPRAALAAAKQLIGQWPHAKPADPETYAASLAAVLAQYPLGLVQECVDPRMGLARIREFPPTVACLVEWLDERLVLMQKLASIKSRSPPPPQPEFSAEHRQSMIARFQALMQDMLRAKRTPTEHVAE